MINYFWSTGERSRTIEVFSPGRYSCRVTTQAGNIDSGAVDLKVGFRPRPRIGNPIEYLCEGDEVSLEAPSYFIKYTWSTGDTTSSIKVKREGTYWLTVTDTNGCTGQSDKVQIVVVPKPNVQVKGQDAVCPNRTVQYSVEPVSGTSYQWFCDGGLINSGQGTNSVHITWSRTGTIRLRASYKRPDGGNCSADTMLSVTVSARLKPQMQYQSNSVCLGDTLLLVAADGYASYLWSTGSTSSYIKVAKGGQYWVEVTDSSGCAGVTDTLTVLEYQPPSVSIKGPPALCEGAEAVLEGMSLDSSVVLWVWNTGQRSKQITVTNAGTYSVVGWTLDGCTDTAYYTLRSSPPIAVSGVNINVGVVPTGLPVGALVTLTNNGATDISVMQCNSSLPTTITPVLPRLVPVGRSQDFTVRYTPVVQGDFYIELTWLLMSADCLDTIVTIIQGTASGDPPIGTVHISVPDTTVRAGIPVRIPITVQWNLAAPLPIGLQFDMLFPKAALNVTGVSGAQGALSGTNGTDIRLGLSVGDLGAVDGDTTFFVEGIPLLHAQFTAPLIPMLARVGQGLLTVVTYDNGSLSIEGCWLPGRLIKLGPTQATVIVYSLTGQQLHYADVNYDGFEDASSIINQIEGLPPVVVLQITDSSGTPIHRGLYFTNSISR